MSAHHPDPSRYASAISRRRVVVGAAWATPAILIATASPPAAASVGDPPVLLVDVQGDRAAAGGNNSVNPSATLMLGAASPDASYMEDMQVTLSVPRANASLKEVAYDAALWTVSPDPSAPGFDQNNKPSVVFTYAGPRVSAPSSETFTFSARWDNGIDANAPDAVDRTVMVSVTAVSGAGPVAGSDAFIYTR